MALRCGRIRSLCCVLALAGAHTGPARAELPAIRVTENGSEDAEPAAWDRQLAWTGVDPDGADREVFWLDTAQPVDAGSPLPCPQSNPCQVSDNAADDVRPQITASGVFWAAAADQPSPAGTLHFSDGASVVTIPGTVARRYSSWSVSGPRVLWFGEDVDERTGLFLFDVRNAVDAGTPAACPGSNPCVIALGAAGELDERAFLHLSDTRAVWSATPDGTGSDLEVLVFDATRAADLGPPGACPLANPCLLTDNDVADAEPVASAERIAWVRCPDDDCWSAMPDSVVVASDSGPIDIATQDAAGSLLLDGPWLLFASGFGVSHALDSRQGLSGPTGQCPLSNPCTLPGSAPHFLVGSQVLLGTSYDVLGPFELRLVDLARPFEPPPYASCAEAANPCIARDAATIADYAYSGPLIVWSECDDEHHCFEDPSTEIYYAVPEPAAGGAAAALLALAALGCARRYAAGSVRRNACQVAITSQ